MRHIGEYESNPVIVLGYNKGSGKVLIVNPDGGIDPRFLGWLKQVLVKPSCQQVFNLYDTLSKLTYQGYPNMDSWRAAVSHAFEVPAHLVRLSDREQAIHWMKTESYYNAKLDLGQFDPSRIVNHDDSMYTDSERKVMDFERQSVPDIDVMSEISRVDGQLAIISSRVFSLETSIGNLTAAIGDLTSRLAETKDQPTKVTKPKRVVKEKAV